MQEAICQISLAGVGVRGVESAEGVGCGEGASPSSEKFLIFFYMEEVRFGGLWGVKIVSLVLECTEAAVPTSAQN